MQPQFLGSATTVTGSRGEGTLGWYLQRGVKQCAIDGQLLDRIGSFAKGKRFGDPGYSIRSSRHGARS